MTIGCIPIEDAGIDEVFVAATDAHAAGHAVPHPAYIGFAATRKLPRTRRRATGLCTVE